LKSGAEARREAEKKLVAESQPVPFPSWAKLRQEDAEEKPAIIITVTDESGQVVRRMTGPAGSGFHRVAWDLRYPPVEPTRLEEPRRMSWEWIPVGPLVVPGTFTVSAATRVDGILTPLGEPQKFTVESLGLASLEEKDKKALLDFQKKTGELQRAMMGAGRAAEEALRAIEFMKKALVDTPKADPKLGERARAVELRIREALRVLFGDMTVQRRNEPAAPSLLDRVSPQLSTTCPITETAKRDYEIAADGFGKVLEEMRAAIEADLRQLGQELEAAGAPWTPGRGLPVWKKG
jgi:hypothetical protein